MNSELIMKTDVLDILFEKRNKDYGAYILRKFYKNRLIKSLGVMITVVIVFSAFTLLPGSSDIENFIVSDQVFGSIPVQPKKQEIKPKLNKPAKLTPLAAQKFVSTILTVDNNDSADVLHDLNNLAIGTKTNILLDNPGTQLVLAAVPGNEGGMEPQKASEPVVDVTKPVDNPDIMPEYPGGMAALRKFLVKNLSNPRDLEEGELISVKVKFVVGYDGKLQRFELVQDGGREFNDEVIRVLKKMPAWIPGKSRGQNVSVFYTIPVKFIPEG